VTNRYERMKMQRRMQRRIRMVVEERRMARARSEDAAETGEATVEIPASALLPAPPAARAIGRVSFFPYEVSSRTR
jgi:hypothetical protein